MPFKNKGARRDDKSTNQRSNFKSFNPKGGPNKNSTQNKKASDKKSFRNSDNVYSSGKLPKNRNSEQLFTNSLTKGTKRNINSNYSNHISTKESAYLAQRKNNDFKYSSNRKYRPANKPATMQPKDDNLIRLNRFISNSGVCSRRKADELIEAGLISVNGQVVTELGTRIDPIRDEVRYNNERLKREKMIYVLLNKPKDYITTTDDPQERRTVMQLVAKASKERIYPVGRLDRNTTGLLLLTNDGNLADKLSHPKNGVTKIYQVELNKNLTQGDFNKIQFGIELEDGFIKPDDISYIVGASKREVGIQIHSGKNRIVRRIFESLGYSVIKLDRVVYANLTKKNLPRGRWRYLEEKELTRLKHFI